MRGEDAAFQGLAADANTVLRAQQEVEDAVAGYLRGAEQVAYLTRGVAAANRAVDLSLIQYREGAADYTTVLTTQQSKLREDDSLTTSRGSVTLSAIALYKALGGGWELREGGDFAQQVAQHRRVKIGALFTACVSSRRASRRRSGWW